MLRLSLKTEPQWFDVWPGVRVLVRPITSAIIAAAKADPDFLANAPDAPRETFTVLFTQAVAKVAVIAWEGVGEDDGTPIKEPTPETIGRLMDFHQIADVFWRDCVSKAFLLADEKKGSAPLPNTTSVGARNTASTAKGRARSAPKT